jgi:hypothetical protein
MTEETVGKRNAYCDRLEIHRVPRVEEFVGRRILLGTAKLFDLMIVALLENGGPMSLEGVAERLSRAGARSGARDMLLSLKKSWRRREPIYEDEAGLLALNVTYPELDLRLFTLGLRPPHVDPLPEPPSIEMPGDEGALSLEEVDAAFRGRRLVSHSATRTAAAVLDAHGRPMAPGEIDQYLATIDVETFSLTRNRWDKIPTGLVEVSGAVLALRENAPELAAMRLGIRAMAKPELERRARSERFRVQHARAEVLLAERDRREQEEAAALRRVILCLVPEAGDVAGLSILDPKTMTVRTLLLDEVETAPEVLESFDVAIGIDIRQSLKRLGVPIASYRTLELGPPRKTLKVNERGDRLRLTPELVIAGSTGRSRPLSDPAKLASDLAAGRLGRVRRALERDVVSLHALYEYARLHRYVRVRFGFLDERVPFYWSLPRESDFLYSILRRAERERTLVEIVLGKAPDWRDPWAASRRGYVSELRWESFCFREGPGIQICDCADVQAVRWAASEA